jgi:hypothetical protein
MAEMNPFSEMKGGEVLEFVHRILLETAHKRRTLLEQSAQISQNPVSATERQEVRALEAAADIIQMAISAGQEAKTKNLAAPEWVLLLAGQGRATMRNYDID